MKVKTLLPAMAMAILAGIALIVFVLIPRMRRETRPATLPPPPMSEWITYHDDRFGFSFMYPPDWHLNVVPADVAGGGVQISTYDLEQEPLKGDTPSDYFKIEFMVVGGDPRTLGETLEDWRRRRYDYDPAKERGMAQGVVAGRESLEERVEIAPGLEATAIYVAYSHEDYGETVLFIAAGLPHESLEPIFRQIVSTFKFDE